MPVTIPPVLLDIKTADPGAAYCPANPRQIITDIPKYLSVSVIRTTQLSYVLTGSATPSASFTSFPWIRTDSAGRPLGTYTFYNGAWRLHFGAVIGELRSFEYSAPDFATFLTNFPCWQDTSTTDSNGNPVARYIGYP